MFLVPLGVAAGILTTLAGLGGGLFLLLVLSLVWDPRTALAVTAPALLLGNLHRLFLYRKDLDRRIGGAFAAGALPGSILGGVALVAIPGGALQLLLLLVTGLAVARAAGWLQFRPPAAAVFPAGFGVGALSASAGAGGFLAAPVLLAAGLTGPAYLATGAAGAASMHVGRLMAYGATGLLHRALLGDAALLAVAILAGNLAGDRLRGKLGPAITGRLETVVLVGCVALALAGVAGR